MTFQISLILFTALPHPQYYSPFPLSTQSLHRVLFQFSFHHHDDLPFQILMATQKNLLAFVTSDTSPDSILTLKCSEIKRENMWYLSFLICYFTHNNNFYSIHLLEILIILLFLKLSIIPLFIYTCVCYPLIRTSFCFFTVCQYL